MTQLRPGARGIRLGLVAVALGGLAGCGSFLEPRVDPSRFYVLSTRSAPEVAMPAAARRRSYGIGPVTLPDYLKRPTVITRISESEIRPSHDDRWGEPSILGTPATVPTFRSSSTYSDSSATRRAAPTFRPTGSCATRRATRISAAATRWHAGSRPLPTSAAPSRRRATCSCNSHRRSPRESPRSARPQGAES